MMGDVAASANDPIFINHHTMIDCILEIWLQRNIRNVDYPKAQTIGMGHRQNDYIVPFIPLYTHEMMYNLADEFGYMCDADSAKTTTALVLYVLLLAVISTITITL